jgi:hypothetical protein
MSEMNYFLLRDEENNYGVILADTSEEAFLKHLNKYKLIDEAYNVPSFIFFLNNEGVKAEVINQIEIYF